MLAPAKVNLFLHVGPAKENGRHDLDSLVMFAGAEAADRLEARKAEHPSLELAGVKDRFVRNPAILHVSEQTPMLFGGIDLGKEIVFYGDGDPLHPMNP